MKNLTSTQTGQPIPEVINYADVQPLFRNQLDKDGVVRSLPVTNGLGQQITNDNWIYVTDRNGSYSINVIRAKFCQRRQLSNVTIMESIGGKKITKNLEAFINQVSEKLVFQKNGIWFRVFLKKVGYKFDLKCVKVYYLCDQNIPVNNISEKYKQICQLNKPLASANSSWAHELIVNLDYAFNF